MTELAAARNRSHGEPRSPGRPEVPRSTTTMVMPEIAVGSERIRLTMHGDNIGLMLRFFGDLPIEQREAIDVEGRHFPNAEAAKRLRANPIQRFYLQLRTARTVEAITLVAQEQAGIDLPEEQLVNLVHAKYSPATLKDEVGYDTALYNAGDMVYLTQEKYIPHTKYLPIFGGANELLLSSSTLSQEALEKVTRDLEEYIKHNNNSLTAANIANTIILADAIIARLKAKNTQDNGNTIT